MPDRLVRPAPENTNAQTVTETANPAGEQNGSCPRLDGRDAGPENVPSSWSSGVPSAASVNILPSFQFRQWQTLFTAKRIDWAIWPVRAAIWNAGADASRPLPARPGLKCGSS